MNQLVREDNPYLVKTYLYTYDPAGNRTSRTTYTYTTGPVNTLTPADTQTYTYKTTGWGDQLADVTYDAVGNPLTHNGYTLTWDRRQLKSMYNGYTNVQFTYNADGIRTSKTTWGIEHKYHLNGSQILAEEYGISLRIYLYDENGSPIGMQYRTTAYAADQYDTYYFEKNLQGDIIAVYTADGTKIGGYTYDAWGNCTASVTQGTTSLEQSIVNSLNPFRYRSYYYDTETGLYYLQSRYYDPGMGRFINADGYLSTDTGILGYNMYAYCNNNPVMYVDETGHFPWIKLVIAVVSIVAVIAVAHLAVEYIIENSDANDAEKELAREDYIAAYQVNEAKNTTIEYIDKVYGIENDFDGTQVNAYRHAMWNAIMVDKIGVDKAKKFADAHEDIPNNDLQNMNMDLHNNQLGRDIAVEYAGQGYEVFSQKIQEAIANGEAEVLRWDPSIG